MKTILAALLIAATLGGAAQAANQSNGGLPDWATKAFERTE